MKPATSAIPLSRWRRQVARAGGAGAGTNLQVHVHENAKDGPTQVRQSPGGLDVLLRKTMQDMVDGGALDGAAGRRWGIKPKARGG